MSEKNRVEEIRAIRKSGAIPMDMARAYDDLLKVIDEQRELLLDCWFQYAADKNNDGTTGHSFVSTDEELEALLCTAGCERARHAPPCQLAAE